MEISLHNNNAISVLNCPVFLRPMNLSSLSQNPHIQNTIICARSNNIRTVSQRSRQFVLDSMSITASNQTILPEQFNVFVRESGDCSRRSSLSGNTRGHNSIITCARKNRRRFGSQRTRRFVLESISIIASKLKILPEPLNVVIREFGGGNGGGGSGIWKGFGGGGGGGGFDGWRRRKGKLGFLMVCCLILLLGKEFDSDLFWGFLGFALFGVSITFSKRGFQNWVFGFCCCLGLMGLGLRREKLEKIVEQFKGCCSPLMEVVRRRRRRRKKWRRAM